MNRSCYFCENEEICGVENPYFHPIDNDFQAKHCKGEGFIPTDDWLEYIKLLDDQIAFREKAVNDLYERDCKIKELQKENRDMKYQLQLMGQINY